MLGQCLGYTYMLKPTWIVVSCVCEFYWGRPVGIADTSPRQSSYHSSHLIWPHRPRRRYTRVAGSVIGCVCDFVCLSVCLHQQKTARAITTKLGGHLDSR